MVLQELIESSNPKVVEVKVEQTEVEMAVYSGGEMEVNVEVEMAVYLGDEMEVNVEAEKVTVNMEVA